MASANLIEITRRYQKDQDLIKLRLKNHINNLIENVYDCVYIADNDGNLYFVNQAMANTLGYADRKELIGKNLTREIYFDPADRIKFLDEVRKKGYVKDYEIKLLKKNGEVIVIATTSNFMMDREGNIIGVEGVFRDITARNDEEQRIRRFQEELKSEKKKLELVLSVDQKMSSILNLNHLVDFIIDKAVRILNVERCSLMLFDSERKELLIRGAKGLDEEVIKQTRIKLGSSISGTVAQERRALFVENIESEKGFFMKNKSCYKNNSFISAPITVQNRLVGVVNVSDKKIAQERYGSLTSIDMKILSLIIRQAAIAIENANYVRELEYLSISDPLTGLFNYRYFIKRLDQEICRKQRYANALALLMIDVDNFKSYNDAYGHPEGDLLLKKIAMILIEKSRIVDAVCRYAGDEFAVILPETNLAQAKVVSEKIKVAIEQAHFKNDVSLSIGLAEYCKGTSRYDLIAKADQSLYEAKKSRQAGLAARCHQYHYQKARV